MEGLVEGTNQKCSVYIVCSPWTGNSFPHYSAKKEKRKSRFKKLSDPIEIKNLFLFLHSFPGFHFVGSVVKKKTIEYSICETSSGI